MIMINSSILTETEKIKLLEMVNNATNNKFTKEWKLLFKGTEEKFSSKVFYKKCRRPNTLSIIQTPQNNIFGGYTSLSWYRTYGDILWESDSAAFVYTVRSNKGSNPKIFPIQNYGKHTIGQGFNFYLIFGHGFWMDESGGSVSSERCPEYNLDKYALNGINTSFKPIEIEVFELS